MKVDWIRVLGIVTSTMLALSLIFILQRERFIFLLAPTRLFAERVGFVLTTYLLLDLVAIAFVLFAAVACCVAMLMPLKEDER